jgi:hypothetical protein
MTKLFRQVSSCFAVIALASSLHAEEPKQPPNIDAKQQAKYGIENHEHSNGNQNAPAATTSHDIQTVTVPSGAKTNEEGKNGADQGTEFWAVFGHRLKITDTVISLFTAFLALATFCLWLATRNLVASGEKASRTQLRAYVGVGATDFGFETPGEKDPKYVPLNPANPVPGYVLKDFQTVTVTNFGQTPAYDVVVFSYHSWCPFPSRLPDNWHEQTKDVVSKAPVRATTSRLLLQPRQSALSKHSIDDVRPITAARNRKNALYVWGRIYYRDIYGRPWRTRFCYIWEPWHPHGARFVPYEEHNDEDQVPLS